MGQRVPQQDSFDLSATTDEESLQTTVASYGIDALHRRCTLLLNFAKTTLEVKRVAAARFELKAV